MPKEGDGMETSSFNEDLSKMDAIEAISGGKPVPRISQNLNLLHNVSVHDEAYISDAGLKELSVVESDNSDQGLDTPAAYLKKVKHVGGGF